MAHKVAIELRDKHGISNICGYVYLNSSAKFLRNQKDIKYGELLVDQEIHDASVNEKIDWKYIKELEREYGIPNLWPYISVDRVIRYGLGVREYPHDMSPYTHEDMVRMLQSTARKIIEFLEKEKPDLIYFPAVSAMGNMLLFYIAKKKGIVVLAGAETRIMGGYALTDDYRTFSFADARFRELQEGAKSAKERDARTYIDGYRSKPSTYLYYMKNFKDSGSRLEAFSWLSPWKIARSIKWLFARIAQKMKETSQDYMDQSPWWFLFDATRRKFRLMRGFADLWDEYNPKERFAYYPLHLEPEMAMLLLSPRWTDQINLIKQIAESLPISFKLYVKEHPVMMGFRPRRYYRELKKIPNVKLIHPNHDSHTIVTDSQIVLTQTGTAGWEALLLKKPVITFGDVYFNTISMTKKCTDIEKLPNMVKAQLENFLFNEIELVNFVSAILENSENISLHELWERGLDAKSEASSIEKFTQMLLEKYKSIVTA